MYLRKPGNWSSLSEQCWCYAIVNLSEEYISESSQIKESHEKIKLLNEKIRCFSRKSHLQSLDNEPN